MIYVLFNGNEVVGVTSKRPFTPVEGIVFNHVETSDDWTSFDQVTKIAEKLTTLTGKTYLPTDYGYGRYPFGLVEVPMIGDYVSYTFNGDYYPCGKVEKISKTYQITVSDGKIFRRDGDSSRWLNHGWSLVKGHRSDLNPSF